jgi:hypothetical protein
MKALTTQEPTTFRDYQQQLGFLVVDIVEILR